MGKITEKTGSRVYMNTAASEDQEKNMGTILQPPEHLQSFSELRPPQQTVRIKSSLRST